MLQFGHGDDAVEMFAMFLDGERLDALQFGHGDDAVEIARCHGARDSDFRASIRPRR